MGPRLTNEQLGIATPTPPAQEDQQGENGEGKKNRASQPGTTTPKESMVAFHTIASKETALVDPNKSSFIGSLSIKREGGWECPFLPEVIRGPWQNPDVFKMFLIKDDEGPPGLSARDPGSAFFIRELYRVAEHRNAMDPDKPITTLPGQSEEQLVSSLQQSLRALDKLCASKWLDDRDISSLIDFAGLDTAGTSQAGLFWWPKTAGQGWIGASQTFLDVSIFNPDGNWTGKKEPDRAEYDKFLKARFILLASHHKNHWTAIIVDNEAGQMYHADSGWQFGGAMDRLSKDYQALISLYKLNDHPTFNKLITRHPIVLNILQQPDTVSCGLAVAEVFRLAMRGSQLGPASTADDGSNYYLKLRKLWIKYIANYCGVPFCLNDNFIGNRMVSEPEKLEKYKVLAEGLRGADFDPKWGLAEQRHGQIRYEVSLIWGASMYLTPGAANRFNVRHPDQKIAIPIKEDRTVIDLEAPAPINQKIPGDVLKEQIETRQQAEQAEEERDATRKAQGENGLDSKISFTPKSLGARRGAVIDDYLRELNRKENQSSAIKPAPNNKGKGPDRAKPFTPEPNNPGAGEAIEDNNDSSPALNSPSRILFEGSESKGKKRREDAIHNAFDYKEHGIKAAKKWAGLDMATLCHKIPNPYRLVEDHDDREAGTGSQILLPRTVGWTGWFREYARLESAKTQSIPAGTPALVQNPIDNSSASRGRGKARLSRPIRHHNIPQGKFTIPPSKPKRMTTAQMTAEIKKQAAELVELKKLASQNSNPATPVAPPQIPNAQQAHQSGPGFYPPQPSLQQAMSTQPPQAQSAPGVTWGYPPSFGPQQPQQGFWFDRPPQSPPREG